jgi:ABC-2 type transport system ATP-binding protein
MKVIELRLFLAEIKGVRGPGVMRVVEGWLERFELANKRDAKVEELSKGNQQRVQLIGTLLHDPDLIILDEPQSGLDRQHGPGAEPSARAGKDLLPTHMMARAERMADEILVHRGRV